MMRRPAAIAAACAGLLAAGCGRVTGPQNPVAALHLDLVARPPTGSRAAPVTVLGQVSNTGGVAVSHTDRCANRGFEWSATFGESLRVYLDPPDALDPCPEAGGTLGPGGVVEGGTLFDGTLYTEQGLPYDAPPGDYVVRGAWKYWTRESGADSTRLRASIVVHWQSVSATPR